VERWSAHRAESPWSSPARRERSDSGCRRRHKPMMPAARLQSVVQHIRGEFLESPGLRLTPWQIQRLWNLDVDDCLAAVQKLLDTRFLREEQDGTFVHTS
jgi:hypothetical protein